MAHRTHRIRDLHLIRTTLALCLATAVACKAEPTSVGSAIEESGGTAEFRILPVPPGDQFVLIIAFLKNVSDSPIELVRVHVEGPTGVGSVVTVLDVQIAPLPASSDGYDFAPGGIFKTFPPAVLFGGEPRCNVQRLVPVKGFELAPAEEARVMVLLEAAAPGPFFIRDHVVEYRQGDREYEQSLALGLRGEVEEGAKPMKLGRGQRPCVDEVDVLPSGG